ncbi:hypothetical protein RRG08_060420 [Elysia crispata]|uniref:Uncharacterized protein n=1 Tax=Elysia crispata TaxID=231223 RepID=A0AAE1ANC3_9GAST|nr:hypothetical protein RRG08_060420 [Elysia crispata]
MFHIALLLLLAGHELRLRPVGATSLTSQDVMEAGSMTSRESIKVRSANGPLTKTERDRIRTILEFAAKNFYHRDEYFRANGSELIEKTPGDTSITKTIYIIRIMLMRRTWCFYKEALSIFHNYPGNRSLLDLNCPFIGKRYMKICGTITSQKDRSYVLTRISKGTSCF